MIILDYLQNLQSEGSYKRSQYLKIMGFKLPDENIVSLEEKMGLVRKYNKNSFNFSTDATKIAFAVGNGNDENICVQKVTLTSNTAIGYTNVVLDVPEDNELPEYGNNHLSKILPFVDFASKVSPTPDYRMYCPVESKNSWYRRMYLKECMWTTQVTNTQTNQRTSLQVVCKIDKSDLKMISDSEFISEICLYSGTLTRIFDTGSNYPSAYCRDTTPDQDLVEVYPFLKIQFEPIPVAKIHATGLMFVFDLQKDNISVTVENNEENVPENSEQNDPNSGVNDGDNELEENPTLEEENDENQEEIPQCYTLEPPEREYTLDPEPVGESDLNSGVNDGDNELEENPTLEPEPIFLANPNPSVVLQENPPLEKTWSLVNKDDGPRDPNLEYYIKVNDVGNDEVDYRIAVKDDFDEDGNWLNDVDYYIRLEFVRY